MTLAEVLEAMVPAFGVRVQAFEEAPQSRVHDGVNLVSVLLRARASRNRVDTGSLSGNACPSQGAPRTGSPSVHQDSRGTEPST
jgi:hypothetical protein